VCPASRNALLTGAALMNCGRALTTVKIFILGFDCADKSFFDLFSLLTGAPTFTELP